jgi:hypothetical protein
VQIYTREQLVERFDDDMVFELAAGQYVVAGPYEEPLRKQECVLVEYASPELATASDFADRLVGWARESFPGAEKLIVRTTGLAEHLAGFDDYLYYMLLEAEPSTTEDCSDITVRTALDQDRDLVAHWLVEAFDDALRMQSEEAAPGAAMAQAHAVLDSDESRSFVAVHDGEDIGHATLLVDQSDELTGMSYVEFLDVLVERTHPRRRAAEAALVRAAWEAAKEDGKPLMGHIVVRDKSCHCSGYEYKILDRLHTGGWSYHHKFQILKLTA